MALPRSFVPDDPKQGLPKSFVPDSSPGTDSTFPTISNKPDGKPDMDVMDFLNKAPGMGLMGKGANAVLDAIAATGRFANKGNQQLASLAGQDKPGLAGLPGKAYGFLSKSLMPQDRLSALMTLGSVKEAPTSEIGPALQAARTKVSQPGPIGKLAGTLATTTTAIPERYTQAVAADSSILSKATPTVEEVSKEYQEAFKKAGMVINSKTYQEVIGSRWAPTDTQYRKLQKIVDRALEKIESTSAGQPSALREDEAFIARSAAAKIERSSIAARNPQDKSMASGAKAAFDSVLENSSLPNIKDLSAKYFRAVAKEHFQSWLPQNKNMSPAALRALIMMKLAGKGDVVSAAAMSPKLVGMGFQAAGAAKQAIPPTITPAMMAMENLRQQQQP